MKEGWYEDKWMQKAERGVKELKKGTMRRHHKSKQRRLTLKGLKQHRINKMRFAKSA